MASKNKRIIFYTRKAKTPIIKYPSSSTWINNFNNAYIEWNYSDVDFQTNFVVEISPFNNFESNRNAVWVLRENSSRNKVYINEVPTEGPLITQSQTYYFRIKVSGSQRVEESDWSNIGKIKLDVVRPSAYDGDVIVMSGWEATSSGGRYIAETHSNMMLLSLPKESLGYYIGNEYLNIITNKVLYLVNDSASIKTFYGQIINSEINPQPYMNIGKSDISVNTTKDISQYFLRAGSIIDPANSSFESNGIQFIVTLSPNEKFTIRFRATNGITSFRYDLRMLNDNIAAILGTFPKDPNSDENKHYYMNTGLHTRSNQYSIEEIKHLINIGGACSPSVILKNSTSRYDFILLDKQPTIMPIGQTFLIDDPSDGIINGVDNSIKRVDSGNIISADIKYANIKNGDYISFLRSFEAFSYNRNDSYNNGYMLDPYRFGDYPQLRRSIFKINQVKYTNNECNINIAGYQGFNKDLCNKRYIPKNGTLIGIENFEYYAEEAKFDDGTKKQRIITTILSDEKFASEFEGLSKIGTNGFSTRWIAIKPKSAYNYIFYPIFSSKDNELKVITSNTIVSDFVALNWDTSENLDFYITGDAFVPSISVFTEDINNAIFYFGAFDNISGLNKIGYYVKKHLIKTTKDIFGNTFEYIDRQINNNDLVNFKWIDVDTDNIKNLFSLPSNIDDSYSDDKYYVYELFLDAIDNAGNYLSNNSIYDMFSVCYRPLYLQEIKSDRKNLDTNGEITINLGAKHADGGNVVVDFFNVKDNDVVAVQRVTEFNPVALKDTVYPLISEDNKHSLISDPNGASMTWSKCKTGAIFRIKADISPDKPLVNYSGGFQCFSFRIKRTIPSNYTIKEKEVFLTDLKDVRMDIVNSLIKVDGSEQKYYIVGTSSSAPNEYSTMPPTDNNINQFDYTYYDTITLAGVADSSIVNDTEFIIDTSQNWPNGTFSQNGWIGFYYVNSNFADYNIISVQRDEYIDFISPKTIANNINLKPYLLSVNDTVPTYYISAEWNGWFWTQYNMRYRLFLRAKNTMIRSFIERDIRVPNNTDSNPKNQINKGSYVGWEFNTFTKTLQVPTTYSAPKSSTQESVLVKDFQKGWNSFFLTTSCKINNDNGLPVGEIALYYRSDVDDSVYKNIGGSFTDWSLPYIVYSSITDDNRCTARYYNGLDFSLINDNELSNKFAMIDILDANTATQLVDQDSSVAEYSEVEYSSFGNIIFKPTDAELMLNTEDVYFVQRADDYYISQLNFGGYSPGEYAPFTRLPVTMSDDAKNDIKYLDDSSSTYPKKYRISKRKMKILFNNKNEIVFEPPYIGTWSNANRTSNDILELEDNTQNWVVDYFIGYPIRLDISDATVYTVISNTHNKIRIRNTATPINSIKGKTYRLGSLKDIVTSQSDKKYFYVPIGQERQLIGGDNVVRKAAKLYGIAYDAFGNNRVFWKSISLKGVDLTSNTSTNNINGGVIEVDINSNKINSIYGTSSQVYDANETERVVGVYESNPLSAPSGFAYWKTINWYENTPDGTTVELYIRTAENERELSSKPYNVDAFGINYPAFTSSSYDVPYIGTPTALDITSFTTDGSKDSKGEIRRLRWLQFKVVLKTKKENTTPLVGNIKITYTTFKEVVIYTKNFEIKGNINRGFLSANVELPNGTNIIWGINTADELDFNKYQTVPTDEAFEILEPNNQFRIAAKLVASGEDVPKIFDINFQYDTDGESDLLNENL